MAFWTSLFVLLSLSQLTSAADEVVLTSSEKKNPEEVDMAFGDKDPAKITEVRREPVEIEANKEKKQVKSEEEPKKEEKELKEEAAEPAAGKIPEERIKMEEGALPEPVKVVEKRRARQHRQKKPPGDEALAGNEDSV